MLTLWLVGITAGAEVLTIVTPTDVTVLMEVLTTAAVVVLAALVAVSVTTVVAIGRRRKPRSVAAGNTRPVLGQTSSLVRSLRKAKRLI